jgi:hypothetical protein
MDYLPKKKNATRIKAATIASETHIRREDLRGGMDTGDPRDSH